MNNETIKTAIDLGLVGADPIGHSDSIGRSEAGVVNKKDFFKFTLEQESDFNLTLDGLTANANVRLLDSNGIDVLKTGDKAGKTRENIDYPLDKGTYYVQVFPIAGAKTDYTLNLSAGTVAPANDDKLPGIAIGSLNQLTDGDEYAGKIGFTEGTQRDKQDFYSFSLDEYSEVSVNLDGLTQNADITILDGDGKSILLQGVNPGDQEESINAVLPKGEYFVKVFPKGTAKTDYNLKLDAEAVDVTTNKLPGLAVGDLVGRTDSFYAVDSIGEGKGQSRNTSDYYTFDVSQDSFMYLYLDNLQANANVKVFEYDQKAQKLGSLIRDSKNSGNGGRQPENLGEFLSEGSYAVEVKPVGTASTDYRLELQLAEGNDGEARELAKDLGELTEKPIVIADEDIGSAVGQHFRDQSDWYKFNLSTEKNVGLTLDGLSANANLRVFNDKFEKIFDGKKKGIAKEVLDDELYDPGTYYVEVYAQGTAKTDYRLSLNAGDIGDPKIQVFNWGDITGTKPSNNDEVGLERSLVRNEEDIYNFSLKQTTDFSVSLDQLAQDANLELYNSKNQLVSSGENTGLTGEIIAQSLEPGDYSLKVLPVGDAETKYRIGVEASPAIKPEAFNVGKLSKYSKNDRIGYAANGGRNTSDEHKFTLDAYSKLNLTLDSLKADASVAIFDSEGKTVAYSVNKGRASEKIKTELPAGDYTARVFPVGSAKTDYLLTMNASATTEPPVGPITPIDPVDPVKPDPITDPNGTMATATSLGTDPTNAIDLTDKLIGATDTSGNQDVADYYKFTLSQVDAVQIVLGGMKANADLALYDSAGDLLIASNKTGTSSEIIKMSLDAGDYYLAVTPFGSAQTNYNLTFF